MNKKVYEGYVEPWLLNHKIGAKFQFERIGYFMKTDNDEYSEIVNLKQNKNYISQNIK